MDVIMTIVVGLVLLLIILVLTLKDSLKTQVFKKRLLVVAQLKEVNGLLEGLRAQEDCDKLKKLEEKFRGLNFSRDQEPFRWHMLRSRLSSMSVTLNQIIEQAKAEVALTKKAVKEGPRLMKYIPQVIEDIETKIAQGKLSPRAVPHLEKAKTSYQEAQNLHLQVITSSDWLMLYLLLQSTEMDIRNAEANYTQFSMADSSTPSAMSEVTHTSHVSSHEPTHTPDSTPTVSHESSSSSYGGFSGSNDATGPSSGSDFSGGGGSDFGGGGSSDFSGGSGGSDGGGSW